MKDKIIFLEDYLLINGLTKGFAPLLKEILLAMNRNKQIVLNASLKRSIGDKINSTVGSIDNMITKLVNNEILIRIDRGLYKVNKDLEKIDILDNEIVIMSITYDKNKEITINQGGKN